VFQVGVITAQRLDEFGHARLAHDHGQERQHEAHIDLLSMTDDAGCDGGVPLEPFPLVIGIISI
jgi:hypothetical protein